MTILDEQALSTIIQMAQDPILILSEEFMVLDLNQGVEKILNNEKKQIVGTYLTQFCSAEELKQLVSTQLKQITLKTASNSFICHAVITHKAPSLSSPKVPQPLINTTTFQYLEAIISQIPASVYWMNTNYIYLGCSDSMAKLLKLASRHDIVGRTYTDLYDQKSAAFYKKSDSSVLEHGISLSLEEPLYRYDGVKLIYLSKKVPLYDELGNIIGMLGISTDITERKKMEKDLKLAKKAAESADRAKTEFIANIGHDIRTPLTGVIGMAEILKNSLDNMELKTEAHIIHDSGEELLSMLNSILDDIKAGNIHDGELHLEPFDLYECVNDLIKLERPTTTAKHLGLFVEIDEKIPQILISDRRKIQRILLNLLGNAIKFTKSGHITVKIKYLGQNNDFIKLQFGVSDTGIGIPQELHHKVFERFYRSSPSYKGVYKGHGLGLHIVKTYVQLLGGQIALISKEGTGSTFQFELQFKTPKDACLFASKPKQAKSLPIRHLDCSNSPLPLCLLIEDSPTALIVLQSLVAQTGCKYLSAKNAEEALQILKNTQVDLIITDIGLPGISGIEFSSLTRQWEKENHKTKRPIIGLTGHAREAAYNECIASGMDNVYTKPANVDLINTIISTYLSNASLAPINQAPLPLSICKTELPPTESELFQLERFVLLDREEGIKSCGDNEVLFEEMLHLMVSQEIPVDLEQMKLAFAKQDFETVEKLAHKIKGGGVYLGLVRLKYACQYVERYWKSGERALFEPLFNQAIEVIETTCQEIKF